MLLDYILESLCPCLEHAVGHVSLEEFVFLSAVSNVVTVPQDVLEAITDLLRVIHLHLSDRETHIVTVLQEPGSMGRPCFIISPNYISHGLDCSIPTNASLLGVSTRIVYESNM